MSAQIEPLECEAVIAGPPDLGGQLFFVGDPIDITLTLGAGDVSGGEDNYLDIFEFTYVLDCIGTGALGCDWAGNDVTIVQGSASTTCTADGNPQSPPVTFTPVVQNYPPTSGGLSPAIVVTPNEGQIRNFANTTCEIDFQIVVNEVAGGNPEKIINEFAGWTNVDAQCDNGENASAGAPLQFDLSTEIARFLVTKDFTDDNPGPVDVTLRCNGGLPLEQSATIVDPAGGGDGFDSVAFSVRYITSGEVDCEILEEPVPAGYVPTYTAALGVNGVAGSITPPNGDACGFTDIQTGAFECAISNEPGPVEITVYKEWVGDFEENGYALEATADWTCYDVMSAPDGTFGTIFGSLEFTGASASDTIDGIYANPNGDSYCDVDEIQLEGPIVSDDSDCQRVPAVNGEECTIVNSIFFEGIPSLSRTGLALMALLMLGVGLVGFRRLV
ncbi:MAG: IPTL-CTERM sorting domain-containing protein [Xanthomonadales bacterium]|nr:IPTL-CTERM sorting domain-containing protein [Xanthomonadales bacterium]